MILLSCMLICPHSYLSVDHAVFFCFFFNTLVFFRRDIRKKKGIFYPGTNSFKTRNLDKPSVDYIIAGFPRARVGKSLIPIDYGQPLFFWLSRDWPSVRTYVRTYASTDCTGGVGETIKGKGGVSQACLAKSTSFKLDIHKMVNWQLSKQDNHRPVSHDHIAGSSVDSLRWRDLLVGTWCKHHIVVPR